MSGAELPPLRRPLWIVVLASTITVLYVAAVLLTVTTLLLGADPTGVDPAIWYFSAFGVLILGAPASPGRGKPGVHIERAPGWLKLLAAGHLLLLAGVLIAVLLGANISQALISQTMIMAFAAANLLMTWFGDFEAVRET